MTPRPASPVSIKPDTGQAVATRGAAEDCVVSDDMAAALPSGDQLWPVAQDTVAQWWATYGKHVPLLASVARLVLAQPLCASAAERNWSVYGKIKNDTTSRMSHEVADKRVYCHEALHLKEKLQTASYNQEVVAWDTDKDSDEEDVEADLAA